MKTSVMVITVLCVLRALAFARMNSGQGGNMMGGGWGWNMGYGGGVGIILLILVVVGVVYMMKRK